MPVSKPVLPTLFPFWITDVEHRPTRENGIMYFLVRSRIAKRSECAGTRDDDHFRWYYCARKGGVFPFLAKERGKQPGADI